MDSIKPGIIERIKRSWQGDASRDPRLDSVRDELGRLKWLWAASAMSPIVYLSLAKYVGASFFDKSEGKLGFFPLPADRFLILAGILAVAAIAAQALGLKWRRRWSVSVSLGQNRHPARLLALYRSRTIALMMISEIPALMGFLLFLVQGRQEAILVSGIASLLLYAQAYPSESRLRATIDNWASPGSSASAALD